MKVWILFHMSSTWHEVIGVYSTQQKAYETYQSMLSEFSGSACCKLGILEKELE